MFGNVIERYDFAVYGYFAPIIGQHFFPSDDPTAPTIAASGLLVLMRLLQGLSVGGEGECTTSIVFLVETCPQKRHGVFLAEPFVIVRR